MNIKFNETKFGKDGKTMSQEEMARIFNNGIDELPENAKFIITNTDKTKKYVGYTLFVDVDGKLEEIDCGSDLESLEELKKICRK